MRVLADVFTALRLVIAACILYAGLALGREAFGAVAAATLIGWTLDTVDGPLARAAADPEPSWLGRHERYIDTAMVVTGFIYLTLIGIIPAWGCVTYLLVCALLVARLRSIALLTVLEVPPVILLPVTAFFLAPLWGWLFAAWAMVALLLDRRRLWVRLGILWQDTQRFRRYSGREGPGASSQRRNQDRP